MMKIEAQPEQRELVLFFILTFLWSWIFWLPKVLDTAGIMTLSGSINFILGTVAVFGPSVAAFGLSYRRNGFEGVRQLWKRGWDFRFKKIWLLPALFLMPVIGVVTALAVSLLGYPIEWQYGLPPIMIVPVFLLLFLTNAIPEEFGWRGYALDRLQQRWSALSASLILGLIWGVWHLPLFFTSGSVQHDASIPIWQYIFQTIILAVLYTWLHNNTGRSVLVAFLFHTTGNLTSALIPTYTTPQGRWIGFAIQLLVAVIVVLVWKPQHLARTE
jgi:membrane protease YdiL (CAAX protease family)